MRAWTTLIASLFLPLSAFAADPEAERAAFTAYDTVKVADGILAFMPRRTDTPMVSGNSVAIVGDDGVLVVDSGHYPSATRRMIAEMRALTKQPVRFLVNTHWHGDHIRGNAVYREAFPALTLISTPATREQFDNDFNRDEPALMRQQVEKAKAALASGKTSAGKPLTDFQRTLFTEGVRELDLMLPDIATAPTLKPSLTFNDALTVHLGKREVKVMFLGRGNTGGDAVVYVPDAKVIITGDLVVYPAPYAFGSFIGEWGPTMRKLIAMDASTIVPGHGPVMHDKAYRFRERFAHGDEQKGRAFDGYFLGPGVPRAFREAKEGPLHDET